MRDVFLAAGAHRTSGEGDAPEDANRLRRMDRFGRAGYLAGTRAFAAAGLVREARPHPRHGVVVGTRHGCRSAITEHAARLEAATRVEDLAPSIFAATVHNTVNGELAIGLGFGGVSETIVSGRTAGLEALIYGARRVAAGDADRILVVAAEGIDDAMRDAWEEEKSAFGERAAGVELVESAAAVLLEARETSDFPRFLEGCLFFEPDARRAAARFFEWVKGVEARAAGLATPPTVRLCGPAYEDFLEGNSEKENAKEARVERFAAAGVYEISCELEARTTQAADELRPHSPSKKIRVYVTRDMTGAVAAVALMSSL
ncbi:MAG: beta-ketoacyl synthase N-terminal-like domain-containing protein [Acidobacteriota bacterium]|nr:beta-ketoacyl synthase N-terminal-like domain-containing protein [Acidobacteriota bacterium]